jgi:hypothetical protein
MKTRQTSTIETGSYDPVTPRSRRPFNLVLGFFIFAILYLAAANTAMADVSTCSNVGTKPWPHGNQSYAIEMDRVKYLGPINSSSTNSRASLENGQYSINLRGWLYYKRSARNEVKNAKVLIYNHGHEGERGEPCQIVKYFVDEGYVVFAPLRRGHSAKPSTKDGWQPLVSTGIHLDRYEDLCLRSYPVPSDWDRPHLYSGSTDCRMDTLFGGQFNRNAIGNDYLYRQRTDIEDQIDYIKDRTAIGTGGTGKLADPDQIALLGHSFGGSAVILANQHDYGQSAVIAVSAAEKSWSTDNPYWEIDLAGAMYNQTRPIYMLQPKNGRSLLPTKVLFGIAVDQKYRSQAAIFPPAPCSDYLPPPNEDECDESEQEDWEQFHSTFIGDKDQVELWGPSAKNFMFRHPR